MEEVITPKTAMLKFCRECLGGRVEDDCGGNVPHVACPFFKYRKRLGNVPVRIHRKVCLDCMGGSFSLVDGCTTIACPLYPYRFGTAPNRKGKANWKAGIEAMQTSKETGATRTKNGKI